MNAALTAYSTTGQRGFKGPNNCGATCALNILLHYQRGADDFTNEAVFLHNDLYDAMGIGRFGAPIFRFVSGFRRVLDKRGVALVLRPYWLVGARKLARLVKDDPVALCMLANRHYGWHWVLVLDARKKDGEWEFYIADGWKTAPLWTPYRATGPVRQAVRIRLKDEGRDEWEKP